MTILFFPFLFTVTPTWPVIHLEVLDDGDRFIVPREQREEDLRVLYDTAHMTVPHR